MKKHAVLFKNIRIADPESNLNNQLCNISVQDGKIHMHMSLDSAFDGDVF
jgi:formylmethanofuran dehydrogenase subunit A